MQQIEEVIDEYIEDNQDRQEPSPRLIEWLREDHSKVCRGIVQTGNTVIFCSCISDQSRQAIFAMHLSWHEDMAQRLTKLDTDSDGLDLGDVLFLLSENAKWS